MASHETESRCIHKTQCPECAEYGADTSHDNLAIYDDGHAFCFSCQKFFSNYHGDEMPEPKPTGPFVLEPGTIQALLDRRLTLDTCKKFDVRVTEDGEIIFPYKQEGRTVAQHIRYVKSNGEKSFRWNADRDAITNPNTVELFGQHLWPDKGQCVIVTEGEIDAMSISQCMNHRWPVVSIPGGVGSVEKAVKAQLQWLQGFEKVVFCFDNDKAGQEAAQKAVKLMPIGKGYTYTTTHKDANECLKVGKSDELTKIRFNAKAYRPDGIVAASELDGFLDDFLGDVYDWPWECLNKKLLGRRGGELITISAGSGIGKSTFVRECMYYDLTSGQTVGAIMLEEGVKDTLLDLASLEIGKPIRRILSGRAMNKARIAKGMEPIHLDVDDNLDDAETAKALSLFKTHPRLYLYDHFGSIESEELINKMRFMHTSLGCTVIYLDHVSIVVSGRDSNDERRDIDVLMTKLRTFVEETNCQVICVSHLRKAGNGQRSYEEGGRTSGSALRGSASILQLSDCVLGLERDQQAEQSAGRDQVNLRVLKDRFTGYTGLAGSLVYQGQTGRLRESEGGVNEDCPF